MVKKRAFPRVSTHNTPILTSIEIPPVFFYPLVQGGTAQPNIKVEVKQHVKSGELLAGVDTSHKKNQKEAQNIHSAVGGTVKSIRSFRYCGEYDMVKAIEVEFGGHLNTFLNTKELDMAYLDLETVLPTISNAGIFDLDIGIVSSVIEDMLSDGIDYVAVNAIEFSPFMILEEKILETHSKEIAFALAVIQQVITAQKETLDPSLMVLSNYAKVRRQTVMHLRDFIDKSQKIQSKGISLGVDMENIPDSNYQWLLETLEENQQSDEAPKKSNNRTLFLRPSTLLAIYEAVFCGKPHIEKYIQIVLGEKRTFILKTFIGVPFFYLLTQFEEITGNTGHFFIDDFIKRRVVFDFTTPTSKHFSHIFALTDEKFSAIYARLKTK